MQIIFCHPDSFFLQTGSIIALLRKIGKKKTLQICSAKNLFLNNLRTFWSADNDLGNETHKEAMLHYADGPIQFLRQFFRILDGFQIQIGVHTAFFAEKRPSPTDNPYRLASAE